MKRLDKGLDTFQLPTNWAWNSDWKSDKRPSTDSGGKGSVSQSVSQTDYIWKPTSFAEAQTDRRLYAPKSVSCGAI